MQRRELFKLLGGDYLDDWGWEIAIQNDEGCALQWCTVLLNQTDCKMFLKLYQACHPCHDRAICKQASSLICLRWDAFWVYPHMLAPKRLEWKTWDESLIMICPKLHAHPGRKLCSIDYWCPIFYMTVFLFCTGKPQLVENQRCIVFFKLESAVVCQ